MGRTKMYTPLEKNAEKCLIKQKFQRELLPRKRGKKRKKGKQDKLTKAH
jgi:hypothetical protein